MDTSDIKQKSPRKRPKEKAVISAYEIFIMTHITAQSCDIASLTSIFAEELYGKIKKQKRATQDKGPEKKD